MTVADGAMERDEDDGDAVLFEGYALYPYRASAPTDQMRWQFGVLAPHGWSEGGGGDPWWQQTQCLVEPAGPGSGSAARLAGRCRFLQISHRDGSTEAPPWDEGEQQEVDFGFALTGEAAQQQQTLSFMVPGHIE